MVRALYEALLVGQVSSQVEEIRYPETFTADASFMSVMMLL